MRGPNISISKGGALGGPGTQRGAQSHRGSGRGVGVQPSPLCEERACMHAKLLQSCLTHATLWTIARQALLSMEFSKQEYWDGLPCPSPGDFPDPGIEPAYLTYLALAGGFFTPESESCSVMSDSLRPNGLYSPWDSPGQNTGVGCLSLLQAIFPIQGSDPGRPHYRQILYQLSHKVQ